MDANAAVTASRLQQVLKVPISLDQEIQGINLKLDNLYNYSLIRKYTPQIACTFRLLQHRSCDILPNQFLVFIKIL